MSDNGYQKMYKIMLEEVLDRHEDDTTVVVFFEDYDGSSGIELMPACDVEYFFEATCYYEGTVWQIDEWVESAEACLKAYEHPENQSYRAAAGIDQLAEKKARVDELRSEYAK